MGRAYFFNSINFLKVCLRSLKTQLKANKSTGVTDAQIDLLLNSY